MGVGSEVLMFLLICVRMDNVCCDVRFGKHWVRPV